MTPEHEAELYAAFPIILRDRPGFDCGDGWYQLLRRLLDKLEAEARVNPSLGEDPAPAVLQIKEKFSGLRVYLSWCTVNMAEAIEIAEREALSTCEACGERGWEHEHRGWIVTRCDPCWEQYQRERP